jgi:putative mycofactocin binding protein MftB
VTISIAGVFDTSAPWRMSPQVSLRGEQFGALAYHHGNRRLVFLKSPELVALVERLGEFDCGADALAALVSDRQRERYVRALGTLVASEIICGR